MFAIPLTRAGTSSSERISPWHRRLLHSARKLAHCGSEVAGVAVAVGDHGRCGAFDGFARWAHDPDRLLAGADDDGFVTAGLALRRARRTDADQLHHVAFASGEGRLRLRPRFDKLSVTIVRLGVRRVTIGVGRERSDDRSL